MALRFILLICALQSGCMLLLTSNIVPTGDDADQARDVTLELHRLVAAPENANDGNRGIYWRPHPKYIEVLVIGIFEKRQERLRIVNVMRDIQARRHSRPIRIDFYTSESYQAHKRIESTIIKETK